MENIPIFPVHIYRFRYENHNAEKDQWMNYLNNPDNFTNTRPNSTLHFTSPNLMREPTFNGIVSWAKQCFEKVYEDMGYLPSLQMTSVWCTKHANNGSHRRHNHGNTLMAGVYYLSGNNQNSGTVWLNPAALNYSIIVPPKMPNKPFKHARQWRHQFEEGTLVIFPGWLEHYTDINILDRTKTERFIMGFNTLPLGPTNTDEFDRYYYAEADQDNMVSRLQDLK